MLINYFEEDYSFDISINFVSHSDYSVLYSYQIVNEIIVNGKSFITSFTFRPILLTISLHFHLSLYWLTTNYFLFYLFTFCTYISSVCLSRTRVVQYYFRAATPVTNISRQKGLRIYIWSIVPRKEELIHT